MKLHFLGTGAADWNPAMADSSVDFRRNSSLLVDDTLLIDPGSCIFEFTETFGYKGLYDNVTDILNTHRHSDHFDLNTLEKLTSRGAVFRDMKAGECIETEGHIINAYRANHATVKEPPIHFLIKSKKDGKSFFYGCDGAWMCYDTYRSLFTEEHIDLMIFDCTIGDIHGDYRIFEHNNVAMVSEMKELFLKICPRFMVSHLARTLHPSSHSETAKVMSAYGFETAYDNMITEV